MNPAAHPFRALAPALLAAALPVAALLSACAGSPRPPAAPPPVVVAPEPVSDTPVPDTPVLDAKARTRVIEVDPPVLAHSEWLREINRVAAMNADARQRALATLAAAPESGALLRFRRALLLEQDGSAESLERAARLLAALPQDVPLVTLLRRSVDARLEARRQSARAAALDAKLVQIKALEKSLQQRDAPVSLP